MPLLTEVYSMTDLSPAARAVWEAFCQFDEAGMHVDYDVKIAAALRAAADQCGYCLGPDEHEHILGRVVDVNDLLAIATELEALSNV